MSFDEFKGMGDRIEQFGAPSGPALLVPTDSLGQFQRGWLADQADQQESHRPSVSRSIRHFTSLQGSRLIVLASIAAIRRSISASHAASAPASAGPSRPPSSSAASSARESGSRRSVGRAAARGPQDRAPDRRETDVDDVAANDRSRPPISRESDTDCGDLSEIPFSRLAGSH